MSIQLKSGPRGVRFQTGPMAMSLASQVIADVYREHGYDCRITECWRDDPRSIHSREGALDFGLKGIPDFERASIYGMAKERLSDEFDLVRHGVGESDHLHLEWDPKG